MLEPVTFEFGSETHIEPDFKERCGRETHRSEFIGRNSPVNPVMPSFLIFQADSVRDVVNRCTVRRRCGVTGVGPSNPSLGRFPTIRYALHGLHSGGRMSHVGDFIFLHFEAGRNIPATDVNRPVGG